MTRDGRTDTRTEKRAERQTDMANVIVVLAVLRTRQKMDIYIGQANGYE